MNMQKSVTLQIPIKIIDQTKKLNQTKTFYSLNETMFDPSKFSPPNSFIENLKKRLTVYEDYCKSNLSNDKN